MFEEMGMDSWLVKTHGIQEKLKLLLPQVQIFSIKLEEHQGSISKLEN